MDSLFEPDFFDTTPSFLSFSSFADPDLPSSSSSSPILNNTKSPTWDTYGSFIHTKPHSDASSSDTSSPDLGWGFPGGLIDCAFEDPPTPTGDFGIFVAGPSTYAQPSAYTHRSTSSTESWGTPQTPGLKSKQSSDSFYSQPDQHLLPSSSTSTSTPTPYSWDEASLNPAASSSSTTTSPLTTTRLRTTSTPTLSTRPRQLVKPVMSMPALREEDAVPCTPSQWFDGTEISADLPVEGVDDLLSGDFDWVFGDYGLGETANTDGTIFAAFTEPDLSAESSGSLSATLPLVVEQHQQEQQLPQQPQVETLPWLSLPVDDVWNTYEQSQGFTIDPMAIMQPIGEEEAIRPSSAPKLNGMGMGMGGALGHGGLSVPMAGIMSKSHSSDGYHTRAPPRDLFTYAPQQLHSGPAQPPPLFTTVPAGSVFTSNNPNFPRALPLTPTQSRRTSSSQYNPHNLSIQIHQPNFSTYMPHSMPITPQSADFGSFQMMQSQPQPQPIIMTRAGTQPLPSTRKLSSAGIGSKHPMPAHLIRAQAIVAMQEAKDEAQRVEMRRLSASRRVGMAEASVMQPVNPPAPTRVTHPRPQPTIMGWEGPSAQTPLLPVLTTAPLVNVHPPPAQYHPSSHPSVQHRVRPPPHPPARPIANLPQFSTPTKRKPSTPKRTPSSRKRATPGGGGFSWGETTFINFTSEDAEKLLTGVAPSGSQSKRKREDGMGGFLESSPMGERERSKRSRSDE